MTLNFLSFLPVAFSLLTDVLVSAGPQSAGLAGEELAKTLQGLGLDENGEGGAEDGNILPIMQSIMQNLLSKEVLYPSLKEITEKVCA